MYIFHDIIDLKSILHVQSKVKSISEKSKEAISVLESCKNPSHENEKNNEEIYNTSTKKKSSIQNEFKGKNLILW